MIVTVYYSISLSSIIIISNVGKPNSHASKKCHINTIDLPFILIIFNMSVHPQTFLLKLSWYCIMSQNSVFQLIIILHDAII